ncbi:hypothetical protein [Dellaglioa carnosa]|uniref:HTH cro/C1-type domain-containing protein n=1 Tax=Dellaglioa carnosa TaxID=2995136 RepID=A0ABT4JKW0_9LACO|nr:hypothetical protein [Dellaglioa carnosa]MCZ2491004.1 hypothetical protein [Dellaglioa carnosa]MCZ2494082.1 hypothetical protein [Dellaglioa carnosa]MDK1730946.1 hypothetical protein [Dellaglioa carnosa]
MDKNTSEFINQIKNANSSDHLNNYQFIPSDAAGHLKNLLKLKKTKKIDVIRRADLNASSAYQWFDGRRNPNRNALISLGFGFELSLEEMNILLKQSNYSQLYAKNKRDAYIIYSLLHSENKSELETHLTTNNLEPLYEEK